MASMRKSRAGITLLEVLVAIFIMGIGMLCVLVLFPLGALNMARALKDDRCGTIARNADSLAIALNLRGNNPTGPTVSLSPNPVYTMTLSNLLNGNLTTNLPLGTCNGNPVPAAPLNTFLPPDPGGASYPVYVDPYGLIGSNFNLTTVGTAYGGYPVCPVSRVCPSNITNSQLADQWYSFTDDLIFDTNGLPKNFTGSGSLPRQGYYTYAYLLRSTQSSTPGKTELWVVVYKQRQIQSPQPEKTYLLVSPTTIPNNGSLGASSFVLTGTTDLARGNWLLDVTYETKAANTLGYVHGRFYRVVEALPIAGGNTQVEIIPPLQDGNVSAMVFLDAAAEVFYRGTGN
jgi:type II secretory pathway pseudopilin PulG